MTNMEKIIHDKQFEFAIKFKWDKGDTHWLNWEAVETITEYKNGEEIGFCTYDLGMGASSNCQDFKEAFTQNPLCQGYIKWDGCMELHELNYHFCGYTNFLQRLVKTIYEGAKEILGEDMNEDLAQLDNLNKY